MIAPETCTSPRTVPEMPSLLGGVWEGFQSLHGSPSELWKAYTLKFLDSYSYSSFSLIFTLFLSSDFGFTDVEAGTMYGIWGALITVYGLVAGVIIDNVGVASSLRMGFFLSLFSRIIIFCTTSRTLLLFAVCGLLPMGNCLGIPVLTTGIRRYTNQENRSFAFGVFYVILNIAALVAGPVVDACTIVYSEHMDEDMAYERELVWNLSGYRLVVLTGVVANVIAMPITWSMREIKIQAPDPHHDDENPYSQDGKEKRVSEFTPVGGSACSILRETFESKRFWRFLVVCLITLNVRMIFRHLDATYPKYMVREFGEKIPKGTIYSINPALVIVLVPIVTVATSNMDPLVLIHHGSYISAASVFLLAMSTSVWSSVMFVVLLSIGESLWSPRLYDYTMSVCREGREGTYGALASAPLFLAKLPVGFMSGYLLEKYCPEEGSRNSKIMWLIIGLMTASSPVLMTIFWKYISYKDPIEDDGSYKELEDEQNTREKVPHAVVCAAAEIM